MKKLSIFAALVVAMGAVSCVEDINNETPAANDGAVTFEASFGAMSKAVLEPGAEESKVAWEAGDQVSVLARESNWLYTAASAGYSTTLSTEATDVPSEGDFYAVYPYDADAALAEGVITTTLPAEQTAVLGSFSTHLAVAQTTGSTLAFKNVCGLVKVTVDADNVTKVVFEGNSSEVVAGGINVTVSDTPSWEAVAEQGATSVALVPAEGQTTLAKGAYYFAVLPQTFEGGFKVTAYKGADASVIRNVSTEYTLERADIVGGRAFGIDGEGTEASPYILKTAQDMVDMRSLATEGGETWFKMANDIDMKDVKGYLPVNYDNGFTRKIHFDGNDKTISNFSYDKSKDGGNYASLFGVLYGSVKNLKVDKANIVSSNCCGVIGGYVGTDGKHGLVENVTITNASVTNEGERAGGVCGDAKDATFKKVSFQGSVTCTYTEKEAKSGGFVGQTESTATFENCSADVTVTGSMNDIGGFAGKTTGTPTFTDCSVKVTLVSKAPENNRAGGFIGWNASTKTIITNCHVLAGSTVTDRSGRTAQSNGNYGGFIGFGDAAAGTVLEITGSSANVVVNSGTFAVEASTFIGSFGSASTTTISGCSVSGELITSKNYAGGLIGCMRDGSKVTITGSNFSGIVKGASGVGGLVGGVESSTLNISKSYVTGTVNHTNNNSGGLVGLSNGTTSIDNSWANVNLISSSGQQGGAIIGMGQGEKILVENCYSLGEVTVSRGAAGIAGQTRATSTEISGCISWVSKIITNRTIDNWSPGAIVGCAYSTGKFADCIRRSDMVLNDEWMTLVDQDDITSGTPPLPDYTSSFADSDKPTQAAYHGKAAAADATISSVAQSLGWSSDIWDFSKDMPTLK